MVILLTTYLYILVICVLTFLCIKTIEYCKDCPLEEKTKLYTYLIVLGTIFWGLFYDLLRNDTYESILIRTHDIKFWTTLKDLLFANLLGTLFMAGLSPVLIVVFHFFKNKLARIYNLSDDLIDSDFLATIFLISNVIMSIFFTLFTYVFRI